MKKVALGVIACLLIIVLFSGLFTLYIKNMPVSQSIKLHVCGSHAVPGMYHSDTKGSDIEVIETDSEGRILFEYSAPDVIRGGSIENYQTALVICQKYDDDYVYFYEDICYLKQYDTDEAIDRLKEQNDWGKALDESKCSRRPILITFDLVAYTDETIPYDQVRNLAKIIKCLSDDQIQDMGLLDVDHMGGVLYYLKYTDGENTEKCFVLVNQNGKIAVLSIENDVVSPDGLAQFKKENGWAYRY